MIVLGCDPSLVAFGWASFDGETPTGAGAWETWSDRQLNGVTADNAERFTWISQQLWTLADKLKPERIFVEGQVFMRQTNFSALTSAGRARGLVDMLGAVLGVQVIEFSPQAVKKGLGIVIRSKKQREESPMPSKQEVREEIVRLYPTMIGYVPQTKGGEGAADALAVAHLGIKTMAYRDRLQSGSSR